jgi:superfamily II DNA or RNA helicase
MSELPNIVDNDRKVLLNVLKDAAPNFKHLSIATGYWDIKGMKLLLDHLENYESIRILIGRPPLLGRDKSTEKEYPEPDFPDKDFFKDLQKIDPSPELKETVIKMKEMMDDGVLEVRVYRRAFLHAKSYIFGNYDADSGVGIIGSSNFTKNGLTQNTELNAVEGDQRVVFYEPKKKEQEVGHLYWFDQKWKDEKTEEWTGEFMELVRTSPVGDLTPSPYDMYIKTLLSLYEDELVEDVEIDEETEDLLYAFQHRNARLLIKRLEKHGLAMLSDSVGLGKTITAGAVIKHYRDRGCKRINVIAPASLNDQWREDLMDKHGMVNDFEILSMQNINEIKKAKKLDRYANVDLFVIDEAHNLRNRKSKRHQVILDWLANNPDSKVLLLTATPVNNQLSDLVDQIQLAAKGKKESFPIVFKTTKKNEVVDFFEAIRRLSSEVNKAENKGEEPDWGRINAVMRRGLGRYLVRSTRKGIQKEFGGLLGSDGELKTFPETKVEPTSYEFEETKLKQINEILSEHEGAVFEDLDPQTIDHRALMERTQRSRHPFDFIKNHRVARLDSPPEDVFVKVFQILLLLGFAPYKSEVYKHKFYSKDPDQLKDYQGLDEDQRFQLSSQLSIHNMLRVNYLKRLESSPYALRISLEKYQDRMDAFEEVLDEGYILSFSDIEELEREYGEDYIGSVEESDVEQVEVDEDTYNIEAIRNDLKRDKKIIAVLIEICKVLETQDDKLDGFCDLLRDLDKENVNGGKVLVFSYYADTIKYLEDQLPGELGDQFADKAGFVSGSHSSDPEELSKQFSPESKGGDIDEEELQYLFATDVLAEGQNLQDCGVIVNFDLHWNPVRMIQRNGRVNRLGSEYDEVYIYNLNPEAKLEEYLRLVNRLEQKVNKIKYSVGNDQSVLGEDENPIEYIGNLYDPEKATETYEALEDDDVFLSEDEYVFDLRKFNNEATDEDWERINKIPAEKWGHYPDENLSGAPSTLGLIEVGIQRGGEDLKTHIFVASDENQMVEPIESLEALQHIRTTPDDDECKKDNFEHDKRRIQKLSEAQAKTEAKKSKEGIKITPMFERVLDALSRVLPGLNFSKVLTDVSTVQEEGKWRKFVRSANRDLKKHGQITPQNIKAFKGAYYESEEAQAQQKIVTDVNSILYYGK